MKIPKKYPHFILKKIGKDEPFSPVQRSRPKPFKGVQDQEQHGQRLKRQIKTLQKEMDALKGSSSQDEIESGTGLQIKFEGFPKIPLALDKLDRPGSGIELLNVHRDKTGDKATATVFVPVDKLTAFERLVDEYINSSPAVTGRPRRNKPLIDTIASVQKTDLKSLWMDDPDIFPASATELLWWEVWLRAYPNVTEVVKKFRELTKTLDIKTTEKQLVFPERVVLLAHASRNTLQDFHALRANIAELRFPKKTAEFFDSKPYENQRDRLAKLLSRTNYPPDTSEVPYVCLLDTGVNRGHSLIAPALDSTDLYTVKDAWGVDDSTGHGTNMAGLALFGNLTEILISTDPVEVPHRLESVKLLPENRAPNSEPELHGDRTRDAVKEAEDGSPLRQSRVFHLAITAENSHDNGQPSSWSASIDSLAVGNVNSDNAKPRLLVVAAGNTTDNQENYPDSNDTDSIEDPAQAWNALTVGAYTNLVEITEPNADGYRPIAQRGEMSPFSKTSLIWKQNSPLKPDVVLEGGNIALDAQDTACTMESLELLTTSHNPTRSSFDTANATSAATALATRLAAQIMQAYPNLWPETVRALIVHSAEWTDAMKKSVPWSNHLLQKDSTYLLRRCGFGVPDLDRALWTVENSTTMVLEESLQPFCKESDNPPTFDKMRVHALPWPRTALENLQETPVQMRVTLSYFIEPSPSFRDDRSQFLYPSHGLRFKVKQPHETLNSFRKRVNLKARSENEEPPGGDRDGREWLIGLQARSRGSIHGDIWNGSAINLANRECIAVYPVSGWWRTRPKHERYNQTVRYALVVSIKAPETDVDLYTEIKNQIRILTKVTT